MIGKDLAIDMDTSKHYKSFFNMNKRNSVKGVRALDSMIFLFTK